MSHLFTEFCEDRLSSFCVILLTNKLTPMKTTSVDVINFKPLHPITLLPFNCVICESHSCVCNFYLLILRHWRLILRMVFNFTEIDVRVCLM